MKIEFYHELYTFFICSISSSFSFMLSNNILIFLIMIKSLLGFFLCPFSRTHAHLIHILSLIDDSLVCHLCVPIFENDGLPAHPLPTFHSVIPSHHYRRCRHCNKNKNLFDVIDNKSFWFKNHQPTIIYVDCAGAVQDIHPSYTYSIKYHI